MRSRTVLAVEDNPITRKMVRVTLESEGYRVLEAGSGREAIRLMRDDRPDLVLQDLILPDMDGFAVLAELRALPGAAEVPILAFSGLLSQLEEARVSAAAFDDVLAKPVEPSRLVQVVRAPLPPPGDGSERFGEGLRLVVADDDPVQLKLACLRLGHLGFEVVPACDGRRALEQARAVRPDAVVTDVLMPDVDGFELCHALRRDPDLGAIPVILITSSYLEQADRDLARGAGASAFVVRTPDLAELHEALRLVVRRAAAPRQPPDSTHPDIEVERVRRVARQLDRQVQRNLGLAQRCTILTAELTVISGLSSALARSGGIDAALSDMLAMCLDAAGASRGAIYVREPDGTVAVRALHGFQPRDVERFFGSAELLDGVLESGEMLEGATPFGELCTRLGGPFLLAPFGAESGRRGALLLAGRPENVTAEDWRLFATAVAGQMAVGIELARAFSELATSERRQRVLMERANDAIFVTRAAGEITDANRAAERLLRLPAPEIVGRRLGDFRPRDEQDAAAGSLRALTVVRADDTEVPVEISVSRADLGPEPVDIWIVRDVTEREVLSKRLREVQKMEAMGHLAAGLAHDFNNLLGVIILSAECLLDGSAQGDPRREEIVEIRAAAGRGAARAPQLLALGRQRTSQPRDFDLHAAIRDASRMLRRVAGTGVRLELDLAAPSSWVRADPGEIEQALLNLAVNARDAMPRGGTLRIATSTVELAAAGRGRLGAAGGSYVVLAVSDTGTGIDAATLDRVFEPFFTTKSPGKGTGLGLATVYRVMQEAAGDIEVESDLGRGTTFRLYFPGAHRA